MAYVTGTANSLSGLLTAIQNACTANGWTLSGSVLHKGTCYVELKISGSLITIRGGTGIDGSNNLTGACNTRTGKLGIVWPGQAFAFPMVYEVHVHTSPDEVYVVCNFNTTYYQAAAFGQSAMPGLVGTGNWYIGPGNALTNDAWYRISPVGSGGETGVGTYGSIFGTSATFVNGGVDHEFDSSGWTVEGAWRDWASTFFRQPNQWNSESILIPIRVYAARPSGFVSPVLECAHARFVNIANLNDQQIITLGTDKWKIYPWVSRGIPFTSFGKDGTGSGVAGHAIRYDGD